MKKTLLTGIAALFLATGAHAAEPNEHWHCGPYDIRIIPGQNYIPDESNVIDDFIVRKNGYDAGHDVMRARIYNCQIDLCPNGPKGVRTAYWSGITRGGKYNGSGELLTINGITHYTEKLMSGKDDERVLRKEKHLCRRVR
jgi:hypothetical protein